MSKTFTISGGKISGNTVSVSTTSDPSPANDYLADRGAMGGGVFLDIGITFAMSGGEISGNTVSAVSSQYAYGGGVFQQVTNQAEYISTFSKTSGVIYGSNGSTSPEDKRNLVKNLSSNSLLNNCGHAVYIFTQSTPPDNGREVTAGLNDNLSYNSATRAGSGWTW
jgi:hypothetical protein